jgi:hypothetical protein
LVEVIAANSPHAKGRVERNHSLGSGPDGVGLKFTELRLAGISTIEEANRFLDETYLAKMNGTFSRPAVEGADAHVPLGTVDLKDILCFEYERIVTHDYGVRFECRQFQILTSNKTLPHPKDRVIVRIRLYGIYAMVWKGKPLLAPEL